MSVKVRCFTNLDTFKHVEWPTYLAAAPRVGEWVQAIRSATIKVKRDDGEIVPVTVEEPTLKVVAVTHVRPVTEGGVEDVPYVRVELHDPNAREFGWLY